MFHPQPAKGPFDPAKVDADKFIEALGVWAIVLDEGLNYLEAYIDVQRSLIVVSSDTWKVVESDDSAYDAMLGGAETWRKGGSGMRFLRGVPEFDNAARTLRASRDEDVIQAKDEITQLMELLASLATQAVSIGGEGPEEERRILTGRYLQARRRYHVLTERMSELESQLDVVAMNVMAYG